MSEINDIIDEEIISKEEVISDDMDDSEGDVEKTGKFDKILVEDNLTAKHKLTGMYKEWFLDYASYVILERAVPEIGDGLKPVQRRILHSMKEKEDGRYNKVANLIGNTMQYHPHGDASIGGALTQLGQKNLLIDTQGNWGNMLTGDDAAAPRYIEARLTKFALEVLFNKKTTQWMLTYDGRREEPVTLPAKFPLLLAQGGEGIAVGLASKILPHNFCELIDASITYLQGGTFQLFPDFVTGGMIDVSRYNDGVRGGAVKVRAKIVKKDSNTLVITELPFGETTGSLIESILKANEKNKIKIKKVDDNTSHSVEIVITLGNDVSSDKTIDALYAFTKCEVSISPNSCVIVQDKPHFMKVTEILRLSAENTKRLLNLELEIRLRELYDGWHKASLEKIFIENRIYKLIETAKSNEEMLSIIDKGLEPFKKLLWLPVTQDDLIRLSEIPIRRTAQFDFFKNDQLIKGMEDEIKEVKNTIANIVQYTIDYYKDILAKYGKGRERKTEIRNFDNIDASNVVINNAKLYVNRKEGFFGIGASMRKEEFVCDCSDIDDIIIFSKSGKYIITKVSDKSFFEKDIYYIGVFRRNDKRTIYNVLYFDGETGAVLVKRCGIQGITRDKEYFMTKGTSKSQLLYMSVNNNGEAEVLKVYFKPRPRLKKLIVDLDFADILIKGRQSQGNIFSRFPIHKIVLKEAGVSTLAGQKIWFDSDINKLNNEGRGELLGEFSSDDKTIVFTKSGNYYTAGYNTSLYFPEDLIKIEKYDADKIYSATFYDAEQKYFYIKRFKADDIDKLQLFIDETSGSYLIEINGDDYPRVEVSYGGANAGRPNEIIDVESFIGVKSHKAKGKRITTYTTSKIEFIEPERFKEEAEEPIEEESVEEEIEKEEGENKMVSLFGDDL